MPPLAETQRRANEGLPEGLRIDAMWVLTRDAKGLTGAEAREEYRIEPTPEAESSARARGGWGAVIESFWKAESLPVVKHRAHKPDRVLEARDFVEALAVAEDGLEVRITRKADGSSLGPEELLQTLVGLPEGTRACGRIVKKRSDLV